MEKWDELAKLLGYMTERELYEDLYIREGLSVAEISKRLGAGTATINSRLERTGVTKRSRGGANNSASQRKKLFYMDQRFVLSLTLPLMANASRASRSVCYHYRRAVYGGKDGVRSYQPNSGTEAVQQLEQISPDPTAGSGS